LVLIAIIIYIAFAFRKVYWPVESWKYGIVAVLTLFHDVLIVLGIFIILGKYFNVEINMSFVAALLTILGYSVNDTIVVFDRIRENVAKLRDNFANIVNISVNETIVRSINTSITTLLVLSSIFFTIYYFGGGINIKYFILTLISGVIVGTYSSIFLASPLLVYWHELDKKWKK
jgi:preprotein translocase subunit SecF